MRCAKCGRFASEDHVCSLGSATIPLKMAEDVLAVTNEPRSSNPYPDFSQLKEVDRPVRRRWPWRKRR